MIYLDNASTTPVDPVVAEKMMRYLDEKKLFGNASSLHDYGRLAASAVDTARQQVASLVHTRPENIIWTSGATESINLALKGVAHAYQNERKHIVTCLTEHKAVLDTCRQLEQEGFSLTYLKPQHQGLLSLSQIEEALKPDTLLVSLMHVNNETGVIQAIEDIGRLTRSKGVFFHVDAAQSAGKIRVNLDQLSVDLMSFSAHKVYGPKGIGALYINPAVKLEPQLHGGGQERGLRAGTLATHQIVGMGEAFYLAQQNLEQESSRIQQLSNRLWDGLKALGDLHLHSKEAPRVPGILSVAFLGIKNINLLSALPNIALSTGSACHVATAQPSHVLRALNLNDELINATIRISLGRFNTESDIDTAIEHVHRAVSFLRTYSISC